jgi:putative protease
VGNVSGLALAARLGAQAEIHPTIPVHNSVCLEFLEDCGARAVWLSPELSLEEIEELAPSARVPLGLVVAGRPRVMTAEHCTLQVADRCVHDCARCGLRKRDLALRDHEGRRLPVRTDLQGRSRIYAAEPLDAVPELPRLLAAGLRLFAVDATLMDADEATRAVERLVRALRAARAGERMPARVRGCGSGHLHHPIR